MISLDEQLRYHALVVQEAYARIQRELIDHKPRILSVSIQRLADGFDVYADNMFHESLEELFRDRIEEYADALNYMVAEIYKLRGGRPR